ncbi:MAG: bifunctional SulP family inorganic anion transporter/carbonic anhydrase [Deltaproteobacteria bacterium]|nr:bifunctional SulP family inorganic anion transporter/carbonic anhydrase [Nannocystaceae bacterium]
MTDPSSRAATKRSELFSAATIGRDLGAGLVVFLIALPLSLGIALASGAPLIAGLVAGVVGGVLVGAWSGSHTSVSGPAAGLAAIVLAQLAVLSFDAFLLAVALAGLLQIALGLARAGALAAFVPTSVIKGLLAAIGLILVLKQIPHLFGHDADPEGEEDFDQLDRENTFTELLATLSDLHPGAAAVGLSSLALLLLWSRLKPLASSRLPPPLAVVLFGMGAAFVLEQLGGIWLITESHLVQVPLAREVGGVLGLVRTPDFSAWNNPRVYTAALTIAAVASLETLLNLEATDRLDPQQRVSPPNRELVAQGVGNVVSGLLGGLPVTSVIVRSSVNIYSSAATKLSTMTHGALLGGSVLLLPGLLNRIPLSCLAAILIVIGAKLASLRLFRQMLAAGRDQLFPFAATVIGIVTTNMLAGLAIGIAVSLGFILRRHSRRSLRRIVEMHLGGEVLRIELPMQVTFLNQTTLHRALDAVPRGSHVLLDAEGTDYIDSDVLAMLHEFRDVKAPARGVHLSMNGFHESYHLEDNIQFVDYSTRELQERSTPAQVLQLLTDGNARFVEGRQLNRDLARQVGATARGQHPLAVVLSCIDSRTPAELVFDMGLGDVFSVRIAGNVLSPKVLGSMEFGCAVAGARLVVVMGHTRCGAVTAAVDLCGSGKSVEEATGCEHLHHIIEDIQHEVDREACARSLALPASEKAEFVNDVARRNVRSVVRRIVAESTTMAALVDGQRIAVVGVLYDVGTGKMEFMLDDAIGLRVVDAPAA